jgi:hypothetical protein
LPVAIAPSYLNCTVYLYLTEDDARQGTASGGSGFLVGVMSRHPNRGYVHLVTNRHVVNGGHLVVRINTKSGGSGAIRTQFDEWVVSTEDDLAVLPFDPPADAQFQAVAIDLFLSEDCAIAGWPIWPGDEVFFYGRFITHDGRQRNKPVVRFGEISMLPDADTPIRVGDEDQIAFLVEARSLSGFSGSPAFVKLATTRLMDGGHDKDEWIPSTMRLLGVDCAHVPIWKPAREAPKNSAASHKDIWVETNSGMAVVIPAWRLARLINDERLVRERERLDRMLDDEPRALE